MILFFLLFCLFFLPITFTFENYENIIIISSGFTNIIYFSENSEHFSNFKFIFYGKIKKEDFNVINYRNSFIRLYNSNSLLQKQNNKNSASFFYKFKDDLFLENMIYFNDEKIKNYVLLASDFFEENLYQFDEKIFVIKKDVFRSFHVNPNVFIINNEKDLIHELSHYFFGNKIKSYEKDIWHEILSESVSMLFLEKFFPLYFENEINLKFSGFYEEPYGKEVLNFMRKFNYDFYKLFEFKRYLVGKYKKMNDKLFFEILNSWRE